MESIWPPFKNIILGSVYNICVQNLAYAASGTVANIEWSLHPPSPHCGMLKASRYIINQPLVCFMWLYWYAWTKTQVPNPKRLWSTVWEGIEHHQLGDKIILSYYRVIYLRDVETCHIKKKIEVKYFKKCLYSCIMSHYPFYLLYRFSVYFGNIWKVWKPFL